MSDVDIAIIGAGPTGLFAAYYAGFPRPVHNGDRYAAGSRAAR